MKTIKTIKLLAFFISATLLFSSCEDDHDDDHDHGSEEELITTVIYTLTNGSNVVTLTYDDPDGIGGVAPTSTVSGTLMANTTYTGSLRVENRTEDPAENVTEEIEAEDDEHEFFFSTTISGVTIAKTDTDGNGNPVGLSTTFTTGAAGTGTVTIVLKHEPTKPNDGTAAGAGGSTDVEAIITDVAIQ